MSRVFFPEFHQLVFMLLHKRINAQHLAKNSETNNRWKEDLLNWKQWIKFIYLLTFLICFYHKLRFWKLLAVKSYKFVLLQYLFSSQIWELADPQGTGFLDKQVKLIKIDTRGKEQATSPTNYCYMTLIYMPGKLFLLLFSTEKSGYSLQNM